MAEALAQTGAESFDMEPGRLAAQPAPARCSRRAWAVLAGLALAAGVATAVVLVMKKNAADRKQEVKCLVMGLGNACAAGDAACADMLIAGGADVNQANSTSGPPLYRAAYGGYVDIVRALLRAGALVGAKAGRANSTALHATAHRDCAGCAEALIDAGADIEDKAAQGWRPLHLAADSCSLGVVKVLLAHKAAVDPRAMYEEYTPLIFSAMPGCDGCAEALIDAGADINAQDNLGWTSLHYAAEQRHVGVVKVLLAHKATVNLRTNNQQSPLHTAARSGCEGCAEALLDAGADIEAKDRDGRTPLIWAAMDCLKDVVKLLLARGADAGAKDDDGKTALDSVGNGKTGDANSTACQETKEALQQAR